MNKILKLNIWEGLIIAILFISSAGMFMLSSLLLKTELDLEITEHFGTAGFIFGLFLITRFLKYRKKQIKILGGFKPTANPMTYFLGIIAILLLATLLLILGFWKLSPTTMNFSIIINLIVSVSLVPVLEEIVFKRIIQTGWENNYGSILSLVLVPIIFGLLHTKATFPIVQITSGFLTTWVYFKTKDLKLCILIHALHNSIAWLTEISAIQELFQSIINVSTLLSVPIIIITMVITLVLFNKQNKDSQMITPHDHRIIPSS